MKCRPRARCNTRRPFQTCAIAVVASIRHYDGGCKMSKRIFRQRYNEEDHHRGRPRYLFLAPTLLGSSISLGDFSILLCLKLYRQFFCCVQGLPGRAAQQTWCSGFQRFVERTSFSQFRPQHVRKLDAKDHGDFLLDSARKSSGEGLLQSRQ